jgi:predicted Fe-Mo cluster-binding NifX family protein
VDIEGEEVKTAAAVANPFYGPHQPGQVPGFIHGQGADAMITGGMGAWAVELFAGYGIVPVTGASGTVRQVLEQLLAGRLAGAEACSTSRAHGHGEVPPAGTSEKDEVGRLREEAEALQRGLDEVQRRLSGLDRA